jgi:hypothetical protein
VFRQNLENMAKVLDQEIDTRGLTIPIRFLTKGSVFDLLKVLMGECW